MLYFIYTLIGFGFLYVVHISIYTYGFSKLKTFEFKESKLKFGNKTIISLIIPFKNEEEHLPKLIDSLKKQTLAHHFFEIICIDDHSTDSSAQIVQEYLPDFENMQLLTQDTLKKGKKNALIKGISHSEAELIVTSDADCVHHPMWLETILNYYVTHHPKLIIAPVLMTGDSLFQKMQSLEFLSLTGVTAGAAGLSHPTMCNGANLIYERSVYESLSDPLTMKELSGDDVFLLHQFKKNYRKEIHYLKSEHAIVYTEAEKTLKSFFKQRFRWASKSKSYTDFDTIFSAIIVFLTNLSFTALFIFSLFHLSEFVYFGLFFLMKFLADFILLYKTAKFFKQKHLFVLFPLLSLIYPFYIVLSAFAGFFKRNK